MPNYQFDKFLMVKIKSQAKPLSGQNNRSSDNYDFRHLKQGSRLLWRCPDGISFDVMEDKTAAGDPVTFRNIKNGDITSFPSESASNGLYIANPKNARGEFEITAYSYGDADYANWMSFIGDDRSVSELAIPGTHDSGATLGVSFNGRCQTLSIYEQLHRKGVRFLDIRCKVSGERLKIYHDVMPQFLDLENVIADCTAFLRLNPRETIIMSVKNESKNEGTNEKFDSLFFEKYYANDMRIWYMEDKIPVLKDVRGKIVLFRRFVSDREMGIDAQPQLWKDKATFVITRSKGDKNIKVQDVYYINSGEVKFNNHIVPMLSESRDKRNWYINYASAIDSYVPPNAATISNVVNPKLAVHSGNFTGVILMDYIDQNSQGDNLKVAKKIIDMNNYIR